MFERDSILLEFRRLVLVPSLVAALTLIGCGGGDPEPTVAATTPAAPSATAATDGAAASDDGTDPVADDAAEPVVQMSVRELLSTASSSVAENRLISPPGNNAFHYYLQVLDQEPRNSGAQVAILELMPLAQGMTEQLIERRNYVDADEAVALLKRAQPSSVVLATLEQRAISYKRADDQRAQSVERARLAEEALVAAQASAPAVPTPAPAPPPRPAAAPDPVPAPPTQVASTEPVAPAAPPPAQENSNFELVTRVNPSYPTRALRQRKSGWVELEFTITATGDVRNVFVVDADPRRTFDRAATRALEAWKFKPRIENGRAVATTARQRLEFSLGN